MKTIMTIFAACMLSGVVYFTNLALTESSRHWLMAGISLFGVFVTGLAIGKVQYKDEQRKS